MTRRVPRRAARQTQPFRLAAPGDLAAALPSLLGFVPGESLIVQARDPDTGRLGPTLRADLPTVWAPPAEFAEEVLGRMAQARVRAVTVVVWSEEGAPDLLAPLPRPELVMALETACAGLGIRIDEVIAVRGGRWYSYLCDDPTCCPSEGVPLADSASTTGDLAARLGAPLESREALAASLASCPPPGFATDLLALRDELAEVDPGSRVFQLLDVYDSLFDDDGGLEEPPERATLMLLVALAQQTLARDAAVMALRPRERAGGLTLWRAALRLCPEDCVAQVAAVVASVAWELGGGALASLACERALAVDPEHSLAEITLSLVTNGVPHEPVDDADDLAERAELLARRMAEAAGDRPTDDLSNSLPVWLEPMSRPSARSRRPRRATGS